MTLYLDGVRQGSTSVSNFRKINYIFGSEGLDGSIREVLDEGDTIAHRERRENGVWNLTGLRLSSSTLQLDLDMNISAVSGFIETQNPSATVGHNRAILPHIQFDDATGTILNQLHIPIANVNQTFVLFSEAASQTSGTTLGQILGVTPGRILSTSIHQVGTIGASAEVVVNIYTGTDNTGTKVSSKTAAANELLANGTFTIDYDEDFGLDAGVSYFQEFVSENTFSLKTDSGGNILTTHTGHELSELNGMSENLVYDETLDHVLNESLDPVYIEQF